ncbi:hypothetical protein QJS66_03305 [Kocuria rhizophila]|nr:hypothetical protein QJS66_03305 [Kocuria rhizophila]
MAHGFDPASPAARCHSRVSSAGHRRGRGRLAHAGGALRSFAVELATGDVLSKMDNDDYYAPHYLADLLDATTCAHADRLGKQALHMRVEAQAPPVAVPTEITGTRTWSWVQDYRVA